MPADDGARRLVNLLFTLNASRRPLTTTEIVSDSDLGYGSANRASDLKKFKRDRETLEERGVHVSEIRAEGSMSSEDSSWTVDTDATYAGALEPADAEALLSAIDVQLARTDLPYRGMLPTLHAKVMIAAGESVEAAGTAPDTAAKPPVHDRIVDAIWGAYLLTRRLPIVYRDGAGNERRRSVAIYGVFSMDGQCYFVGLDDVSGQVRTFRADRVVRAYRPKDEYKIPADFSLEDYLFLPFDFEEGTGVDAVFSFPDGVDAEEIRTLSHGRGTLERADDGSWRWRVRARSVRAAAAFALGHARMGMRCLEPAELVEAWNDAIERVVEVHADEH